LLAAALMGCNADLSPVGGARSPLAAGAVTTWEELPILSRRWGHATATLGDKLVLFGGHAGDELADTWEWDGAAWTRRAPAVSPGFRWNGALATLGTKLDQFRHLGVEWNGLDREDARAQPARSGPILRGDAGEQGRALRRRFRSGEFVCQRYLGMGRNELDREEADHRPARTAPIGDGDAGE
jgi:hypothetical protein